MPRITLVRHGKAAAGWEDTDPPLDDDGRVQADAMAIALGDGPRALVSSPLRRARETAAAVERRWNVRAGVDGRVGEVVAPNEFDVATRSEWLRGFLAGTYADAGVAYSRWRDDVLSALRELPDGAVVVTHFVAINAAIGKALGDERVLCRLVDNCSRTILDIDRDSDEWRVVEMGTAAQTVVN